MTTELLAPTLDEQVACVERLLYDRETVEVFIGRRAARFVADREDLHLLASFNWFDTAGYLTRIDRYTRQRVYFHREVLGAPPDVVVDHINRKKFDNRKANLRLATRRQNACNVVGQSGRTSQYKGVSRSRYAWICTVQFEGRKVASRHRTEIDAAITYDRQAKEMHGEFALLNFPELDGDRADKEIAVMEATLATLRELIVERAQ